MVMVLVLLQAQIVQIGDIVLEFLSTCVYLYAMHSSENIIYVINYFKANLFYHLLYQEICVAGGFTDALKQN